MFVHRDSYVSSGLHYFAFYDSRFWCHFPSDPISHHISRDHSTMVRNITPAHKKAHNQSRPATLIAGQMLLSFSRRRPTQLHFFKVYDLGSSPRSTLVPLLFTYIRYFQKQKKKYCKPICALKNVHLCFTMSILNHFLNFFSLVSLVWRTLILLHNFHSFVLKATNYHLVQIPYF